MINPKERKYLKSKANQLKPVVLIGKSGLSDESIANIELALEHHELIKVKFIAFKTEKKALSQEIVQKVNADFVGLIGNVLIIYRMNEDPEKRQYQLPD